MTHSVIEKSCHRPSSNDRENILERSGATLLPSALYGAEVGNRHERRRNTDKLQKAENTAMRRILKAPKWAAKASIRGEIGISNMKSRIG